MDQEVFKRGARLNTWVLALTLGLGAGALSFTATVASMIMHGGNAGGYLSLLGVIFPGYSVSPFGAFVGAFWAAIYAGLSGAFVYHLYVRSLGANTVRQVFYRKDAIEPPMRLTMRLSVRSLGVAVASLLAIQLFLTTNWLVIRGTADESHHAALLAHYLPGYTVSVPGSFIGSFWIFIYALVFATVVARLYNWIAARR